MPTNYPALQEGVNPPARPQPAYYAVIPASVRYCKGLQPAAKLLFGEITALCSVEGFCWASNAYFCDLYEVDRSTLQRWLAALSAEGFIRVELVHGTGERRIFDLTLNAPTPPQKCGGGAAKMPLPRRKNAAHSITKINTKSITPLNVVGGARSHFVEPGPMPAREVQKQEQQEKGQAAPASRNKPASPSLESWKETKIDAVVAVTDDGASRKRFQQLLDICDGAACVPLWDDALDALKHAVGASTGRVERPGAYFCSMLVNALNTRGVRVPVGKPSERRSVRGMIAASLATADAAEVGGAVPDSFAASLGGEVSR